jgi:serine/threonine-protein kinase
VRGEVISGRYRLERELGHGSMGEVWLAQDIELERPVALKLLAPDADRARFEREARAAAALGHPNVTQIYDYGDAGGRPFMALEYLPGGSLEDKLSAGRPLDDAETAAIAAQLAAGLGHAHAEGLVHRDLKPANVMFGDSGRLKIADFGIARLSGAGTLTEAGTLLGTAAYISPEQAEGQPATPASDVYSFGVILYRMLTGRLPFEAESAIEVARMHISEPPPPPSEARADVPSALAAVATASLAKDPADRPPDGAALVRALATGGATISEEPTLVAGAAGAPTLVIPRRRPRRQRPRATIPLLIAGALLLAATGVGIAVLATRSSGSSKSPPPTHTQRARSTRAATTTPAIASSTRRASTARTTTAASTRRTTSEATTVSPPPPPPPPVTLPPPPPTTVPTTVTIPPTTSPPPPPPPPPAP